MLKRIEIAAPFLEVYIYINIELLYFGRLSYAYLDIKVQVCRDYVIFTQIIKQ